MMNSIVKSRLEVIILILFFGHQLFSKGIEGDYVFSGKVYVNNILLKNSIFYINDTKVISDSLGYFTYKVQWSTNCPYKTNVFNRRKWIKKNNPKYIVIKINNKEIKIRNKWRKFGLKQVWKNEKKQMNKDIRV